MKRLWATVHTACGKNETLSYMYIFSAKNAIMQWRRNEFESGGHTPGVQHRKKCCRVPSLFWLYTSTSAISRLVSAFVMVRLVSTVWSVSCLLFFYSCPAICKSGETCPFTPCNKILHQRYTVQFNDTHTVKLS